jgi:hypothetical protein
VSEVVATRLSPEDAAALDELALEQHLTRAELVRQLTLSAIEAAACEFERDPAWGGTPS